MLARIVRRPFAVFTALFAVLAAFVFWGTWSLDFVPVMPDCANVHPMAYANVVDSTLRRFISEGRFIPSDILWNGLLFSPYFCQELMYAVGLYCSGLALAWFLLGRGLSPLASYGAGLFLSFCGYWSTLFSAGHGGWFIWMTYGIFAFGLVDRAICRGKLAYWALLGACVAWGSFNQPDLWFLFTAFTGAYFVFRLVCERKFPWKGILLAGVVCAAVGAPSFYGALTAGIEGRDKQIQEAQTVPNASSVDEAEKRWIFVTNWSLPPSETLEFLVPRLNGDTSCPLTLSIANQSGRRTQPYTGALGRPKDAKEGNYRQHSLYVGFVTCLLALVSLVALVRGFRSRNERELPVLVFFTVAAVLFWLFSLGRYCEPVYRVVYALPFGDYVRAPVKWHHLTEFCICLLAGYGIDFLVRNLRFRFAPVAIGLVIFAGAWDLARIDRLYCAPVNVAAARKANCGQQLTMLRRNDFNHPQVKAMTAAGRIIPQARPNPDVYIVGVLSEKPFALPVEPLPSFGPIGWAGVLSVLASLFALLFSFTLIRRKDNG